MARCSEARGIESIGGRVVDLMHAQSQASARGFAPFAW